MAVKTNCIRIDNGFYMMKNAIFQYGLRPIELVVYSYLVSCAGRRDYCWPSMEKIAANCGCGTTSARNAVHRLEEYGFIRIVPVIRQDEKGNRWQTNNHYYIQPLPGLVTKEEIGNL